MHGVDALVTDVPGVCLGVTTADCVPVLLYDPVKRWWLPFMPVGGMVKQIVLKTIRFMEKEYGCNPEAVLAGIGPVSVRLLKWAKRLADSIHRTLLAGGRPPAGSKLHRTGKLHLDLSKANRLQLLQAGVSPTKINEAGLRYSFRHEPAFCAEAGF